MARKAVGEVFVDFEGKTDGLEKATKKAERIVKDAAKKLEKESRVKLFSDKLQGALGALAGIEAIARLLPAAFDGVNFAVKSVGSSMKEADDAAIKFRNTIKSIPVVGTIAGAAEQVRNAFIGEGFRTNEAILAEEQAVRDQEEQAAAARSQRAGRQAAEGVLFQDTVQLSDRVGASGLIGFAGAKAGLTNQLNDRLSSIEEQFNRTDTLSRKNIEARERRRELAFQLFDNKLDQLRAASERTGDGSGGFGGFEAFSLGGGGNARSQQFSFQRSVFGSPSKPINVEGKALDQLNENTMKILDVANSVIGGFGGGVSAFG